MKTECKTCAKMKCPLHPNYEGRSKPKCSCEKCWELWDKREVEFNELVHQLREQTFHMSDKEAEPVINAFLEEHPQLLFNKTKDWFMKYC